MLTWDLPEDNIAHEFLKSVCVETRSVHRYSVLQKRKRVLHGTLALKHIDILTSSYPIMNQSFPRVFKFLYKSEEQHSLSEFKQINDNL